MEVCYSFVDIVVLVDYFVLWLLFVTCLITDGFAYLRFVLYCLVMGFVNFCVICLFFLYLHEYAAN